MGSGGGCVSPDPSVAIIVLLSPRSPGPIAVSVFLQPEASPSTEDAIIHVLAADPDVKSFTLTTTSPDEALRAIEPAGISLLPCYLPGCQPLGGVSISYFSVIPVTVRDASAIAGRLEEQPGVLKVSSHRVLSPRGAPTARPHDYQIAHGPDQTRFGRLRTRAV